MSVAALSEPYLSVKEYLASEKLSPIKREYLGGVVYAMAGTSESHNRIAANLGRMLGVQLRGRSGRASGIAPASPPTPPDVRDLPHPAVEPGTYCPL